MTVERIGSGDTFGWATLASEPIAGVLATLVIAVCMAMLWAPVFIGPLRQLNRQKINKASRPVLFSLHHGKQGTPTMGGLFFLLNTLVIVFFLGNWPDYLWLILLSMLGLGLIGLTDDYLNAWSDRFGGLSVWHKFALQTIVALTFSWQLWQRFDFSILQIPFWGSVDLGIWMILLGVIVLTSVINAVNLTDGLDGLAGGVGFFALLGYLVIALVQGQILIAALIASLLGSLVAFLWFNIFPARFFMGDVGSLALGGFLGMVALLTGQVMLLPVFGLVFVLETISVILQVIWRRFFGKKLFTIAPFHHHFEKNGWPETKVSQRFWLLGMVSCVAGLVLFFLNHSA